MPANSIERIEVITNPSANTNRMELQASSNIVMKRTLARIERHSERKRRQ